MDKYIVVVTMTDSKKIVKDIIDVLLAKKLVASTQVYECNSEYWWMNNREKAKEYRIELRTKLSMYDSVQKEILARHNYDVSEIIYYEIHSNNKEYLKWIDDNIGSKIVNL